VKKAALQNLTPQEIRFVDAITTPNADGTSRSNSDAAEIAGYNRDYGRQLRHRPKIVEAVMARCSELEAELSEPLQILLRRLMRDAQAGDNAAAAIILRAMGRGGNNLNLSVGVTVNTFEDKLEGSLARRGLALNHEPSGN